MSQLHSVEQLQKQKIDLITVHLVLASAPSGNHGGEPAPMTSQYKYYFINSFAFRHFLNLTRFFFLIIILNNNCFKLHK